MRERCTAEFAGLPLLVERFDPQQPGWFDAELDAQVSAAVIAAGTLRGVCNLAGCVTDFAVESDNLRETLRATVSGSINRRRQLICALGLAVCGTAHVTLPEIAAQIRQRQLRCYLAEAGSELAQALQALIGPLLVCSEYFGPAYRSGETVGGVLHQDLQQTSFAAAAFDLIITAEVFEHIPDALRAEREIVRLLRPGGVYCFTVPFLPYHEADLVLAEHNAHGELLLHAEAQYHGDPIRPQEGALVYRLFSQRGLTERFSALGCRFSTYRFWSKAFGMLGNNGFVCVVEQAGTRDA
jgi:SAM-dependent methyltransferase